MARGNKSALFCLSQEYPELTRQKVSDFAKTYRELKSKDKDSDVAFIKRKKIGRPSILPEDMMEKLLTL